jgi:hypothetical protein
VAPRVGSVVGHDKLGLSKCAESLFAGDGNFATKPTSFNLQLDIRSPRRDLGSLVMYVACEIFHLQAAFHLSLL